MIFMSNVSTTLACGVETKDAIIAIIDYDAKRTTPKKRKWDFDSDEDIHEVLESGSAEDLEAFRNFKNLTSEKLEFGVYCAKLRRQLVEESDADVERRTKNRPQPDEEELRLGNYWEVLEPHVRAAVKVMRRKGYSTWVSGFSGVDGQAVGFEGNEVPPDFQFSDDLRSFFQTHGAKLELQPDAVQFTLSQKNSRNELQEMWDRIAAELPDLGRPAPASSRTIFHPKKS